jgi:4-hydroxy-3-methylbut-2-enyl diphosphate reductase
MSDLPLLHAVLAFDANNRVAVRRLGNRKGVAFSGEDLPMATQRLGSAYADHTPPVERFDVEAGGRRYRVSLAQVQGESRDAEVVCESIDALQREPDSLAPSLSAMLAGLEPYLVQIPYLNLGEADFIYKFRPEKERNPGSYARDSRSSALYQSKLCDAIKLLTRRHERTATAPVTLNFGPVEYVIPSHFGFCLGVKNAIERAYETLAANPGRRVFMLSELIHNPFVNEDLLARGLRYLQTDKGVPLSVDGRPAAPRRVGAAALGHADVRRTS